ncbi:MAG TPA: hypothetical protein VIG32_10635 [Candidatus Baltobacteraceae bacterium]
MKKFLPALLALGFLAAGCSGGGGGQNGFTPTTTPPVSSGRSKTSVTFRVPIAGLAANRAPMSSSRKPMYISDATQKMSVLFDGHLLIDHASVTGPTNTTTPGTPGSSPTPLPDGTSVSYTTTPITDASGVAYYQVTATFDTSATTHTIGVVLMNGACTAPVPPQQAPGPRGPCDANSNGFVLSEGTYAAALQPGANAATLMLHPVADSGFICAMPLANCGNPPAVDPDGTYHLAGFVSDQAGEVILQQTDPSTNAPLTIDNGTFHIVTDQPTVVALGSWASGFTLPVETGGALGPFNNPGNYSVLHLGYAVGNNWKSGYPFSVKCIHTGSAIISMQMETGTGTGTVAGFAYSSANYPAANALLGMVPANQFQGNQLHVSCDASLVLTIQ